jgi:hypothetical protein
MQFEPQPGLVPAPVTSRLASAASLPSAVLLTLVALASCLPEVLELPSSHAEA